MRVNVPRQRLFWAVGLGHFVNDIFMSMGPVLLAFISVTLLPMTNTQIGLVLSATQLTGAVSQPWFGWLADRNGGRWLAAGGVLWTVGFLLIGLVGAQTGYYGLLFIPFVARALGSGAFHPAGAMHAADSDPTRAASNLSYFFLLGQSGLALGPFLAGVLLDAANPASRYFYITPVESLYGDVLVRSGTLTPIFLAALMVMPAMLLMLNTLPNALAYQEQQAPIVAQRKADAANQPAFRIPWRAFTILGVMVALRSLAQPGSVAFIPVLFQNKGWSPAEYGAITSSFWIASGLAGVFFGNLADRFDRRIVVAASMAVSAPAFFLLPIVDGSLAFAMAVAAGGLSGGSHSIIVVLAQELIPGAKGFASGAILGFIFGTGALGSALIGILSDQIGLGTTFQIVSIAVLIASVIALALPARQPPPPAAAPTTTEPAAAD